MNNAVKILTALDQKLNATIDLTLYGRAALVLGFEHAPEECALSQDVDAVFRTGQAEELLATTNFWEAVDAVNAELSDQGLYISHFFEEDQVILRSDWRAHLKKIEGPWNKIDLYRLGDLDLLLSKLMRDDPIDLQDALFIQSSSGLELDMVRHAVRLARIPPIPEIEEQFALATRRFFQRLAWDSRA